MHKRAVLATMATVVLALPLVPSPAGAEDPPEVVDHCVQHVVDELPSGELILSEPACYPTFEEAMEAEGVAAWGADAAERAEPSAGRGSSFTLAIHYDFVSLNPAGGTTSTVGTSCSGGWLNASAPWNNRIGSTLNGCPSVLHTDGANLTGDQVITLGVGGNLGAMNNRTSSIQYF